MGLGPPRTASSIPKRSFGVEAEKKLARILHNPNLLAVDPAPLRRARRGGESDADATELREALDRRVPAKLLFQYRQRPSTNEVHIKTWDNRWQPVLAGERLPDDAKRPQPPPGTAKRRRRTKAPHVLERSVTQPQPVPPLTVAYKDPSSLLTDPRSLERVRRQTEQDRRQKARRAAHELRMARQTAHRLPRPGESYAADSLGTVSVSCGSSFPRSSVNATLRRWSKPSPHPTAPLEEADELSATARKLRGIFARADHDGLGSLPRAEVALRLRGNLELPKTLNLPSWTCELALDAFTDGCEDAQEEVDAEGFVRYFADQVLQQGVADVQSASTLPAWPSTTSLHASTSNWSVGSFRSIASEPNVGAPASEWGLSDRWKGVDPTLEVKALRSVTPPQWGGPGSVPASHEPYHAVHPGATDLIGRPLASVSAREIHSRPSTSGTTGFPSHHLAQSAMSNLRPGTSGGLSALSFGSQSARGAGSDTSNHCRQHGHHNSRSSSPRHRRHPHKAHVEGVLREVMGKKYPGPPPDYRLLPMPRPPPRLPPPLVNTEIWAQLSGELSFERDSHAKRANTMLREGGLSDAVTQLTVAIDRHGGVESTADQRATAGEDRPGTSEAAARLVEQRSYYYLVAGDIDAALQDAETAIRMSKDHPLGNAKAHYRKALALQARSVHLINKVEGCDEATKRRELKHDALRSVSIALQNSPKDSRYERLYNRLWREINTDFSDTISETFTWKEPMKPPEAGARARTPTPPPRGPATKKKGDWSPIDLSDMETSQAELRVAADEVLSLIEGGKMPDAKQIYSFQRTMKKNNVPNKLMNQVTSTLDGSEPEDGAEVGDAKTALMSLQPRETPDEWKHMEEILEAERGFIMVVFRFYCVEGGATDAAASNSMNLSQWIRACKDFGFGQANQPGLSTSELPLIFLRANQDKVEEAEFTSIKAMVKQKSKDKKEDNEDEMVFHEFAEGCIRLSYHWKRNVTGIANRFQMLVEEKIKDHKCFSNLRDDIDDHMESDEMAAVLETHSAPLRQIFVHYAAADKESFDGAEQDTINMVEWQQLMRECGLFDGVSTVRTATAAFVKVNMADDLYDDDDGEEGDSAEELVYDEFVECVARVAAERERTKKKLHTNEQAVLFAEMVEGFIRDELVPMFLTRVKGKSKGAKKLKAAKNVLGLMGKLKLG